MIYKKKSIKNYLIVIYYKFLISILGMQNFIGSTIIGLLIK